MSKTDITRIGVIGAGSWGTTLANLLADKGYHVDLWVREEEVYKQIKEDGINKTFLPGIRLGSMFNPVKTFEQALADKDLVLMVVPSHVFRDVLLGLKPYIQPDIRLMTATKGIENDSLKIMSQVVEEILPDGYSRPFACLARPRLAREVVAKQPTAVTISCRDLSTAARLQTIFSTEFFRVYT